VILDKVRHYERFAKKLVLETLKGDEQEWRVVDSVVGVRDSASLLRSGKPIAEHIKIQFFREVDSESGDIPDHSRKIFFIAAWRLWSCPANRFLKGK